MSQILREAKEPLPRMDLETAMQIVAEYEDDPYERVEGTWIGAGRQMFYRDKKDGRLHHASDGNNPVSEQAVNRLKDITPLREEPKRKVQIHELMRGYVDRWGVSTIQSHVAISRLLDLLDIEHD